MPTETERPAAPDLINGMGRINRNFLSLTTSSTTSSQSHQPLLGGSGSIRIPPLNAAAAGMNVKLTQGVGGGGNRNTVKIQNPSSQLLLEQKVASLEKRLLIVENFIGSKFCGESFLDFVSVSLNQAGGENRNDSGLNSSQKKRKGHSNVDDGNNNIDAVNGGSSSTSDRLSHQEGQGHVGVASSAVGVRGNDNIIGPDPSSSTSGFSSAPTSSSAAGAPCTVVNTFSLGAASSSVYTSVTSSTNSSSDLSPTDATTSSADTSNFACTNGHGQDEEMDIGNVKLQKLDTNYNYHQNGDDDNENEHVNIDDIENFGNGGVPTNPTPSDQPSIILNTRSGAISCFGGNGHDDGVTYTTTGMSVTTTGSIGVGPPPLVLVPTDNHSDDGESHQNFIEDEESFGIDRELEETRNTNQSGNANDEDTESQNHNHEVTTNSNTPKSTSMPQSTLNGAAMPSEEYLKRIGYRRRLTICPYCKNPCNINNRYRHLQKHCEEVTPEQLRFEESKKGSVEHWPKPTLADYENFYKAEESTGYFDMGVQKEKMKSAPAAAGSMKKKSTTINIVDGQSTLSQLSAGRGRGRPKGTFKIYKCKKCDKKMLRTSFEWHQKKCVNNPSGTDGQHDDHDDDGVASDRRSIKPASTTPTSTSINFMATPSTDDLNSQSKIGKDGQSTLSKRGRGRPKGTFKIYKCEKCRKRMHRIDFNMHKKKCANNLSDTEDQDDDEDNDDGDRGMKRASATPSSSRNSVVTPTRVPDKIGNCTVCGRFMLSRSIPRHLREACIGVPGGRHQSQSK